MAVTPSWETGLAAPDCHDHVAQLYTDEGFLARGVARFLQAGLAEGAAAVVLATRAHEDLVTAALGGAGVDVAGARGRGQLAVADAAGLAERILVDGMPDRVRMREAIVPMLERARAVGRGPVRVFGDVVELLRHRSLAGALRLEELWNELIAEHGIVLLCAYGIDVLDRRSYRDVLPALSRCHSDLIPVEDYERLERAVDRAYADVFGDKGEPGALRRLFVAQYPPSTRTPAGQAALLAIRQFGARIAEQVLDRTRHHYYTTSTG